MLVLSRKPGEAIKIGDDITVVVTSVRSDRVRIGIQAPKEIRVERCDFPKQVKPEEKTQQPS